MTALPTRTTPRLAVYLPHLRQGGGELSMLRLASGLARGGLAVDLVVHSLQGAEVAPPAGMPVVELGHASTLGSVRALAAWLRGRQPGWLLSAFPHTNVAAVAAVALAAGQAGRGQRWRSVLSEHAPLSLQIQRQSGWRWRALPPLVRWAYPRADAVVAVSDGVRRDLQGLMGMRLSERLDTRLHTIANPVLDAAPPASAPQSTPPHPWLMDPKLRVVLSVSRLSAEKDIPTLLRAFARLHALRPHTRLLLAGDGPERAALQATIEQLGLQAVACLGGRVQSPQAWMQRAAVFALASQYEGFGNVLVEALASGCAVVATDCPVGPREILENGRWGALVPVGHEVAMAAALQAACDAPGAPPGAAEHASQYTDAAACSAYRRLLDSLNPC
jgi:glycosyltransferase involved in cell wall biosynthesis